MKSIRATTSGRLERNALALMAGTVTTALVGLLFWTAATHFYTTAEVGRASAVLAAAGFLGNLSHLNIGNVYARFLPTAGQRTRSLVRWGLVLTGAVGLVLGTGFALLWPSGSLFASGIERTLFPLAVGILTVFTVQDAVLLGVGAARWIPVENLAFSVAKLVLLVALAGVLPRSGLVAAWVAPALVAVVVIVILLHRTFMPRHMGREDLPEALPRASALAGYAAGELTTGLMIYIVPMVLPLIIVTRLGNEANAYFAIPEVISSALTMLTWNIAVSFVVEAAANERRARALARRSLGIALAVGCAGAATLLAGAPLILSIFGPAYADQGTTLLRLMALTAPATVVTVVYTSVLRIHRKVGRVVAIQVALCGIVLTLVSLLIGGLGIVGVGIAYLCAEGGVAVVVLVPLLRSLREPGPPSAESALPVARPRVPPGAPDGPAGSSHPAIPSAVAPQVSAPGWPVTPTVKRNDHV
jgi:O-antigen/teichoic acid export membrane protein